MTRSQCIAQETSDKLDVRVPEETAKKEADKPSSTIEQTSQPAPEDTNYSLSAAVARNYELETLYRSIISSLNEEDHTRVAELIGQALANSYEGYLEYGGVLHRIDPIIRHLVFSLPDRSLSAYRRKSSQSAQAALAAAIHSGDVHSLLQVSKQYPNTIEGNRAQRLLISHYRDQGELRQARLLVDEYLEDLKRTPEASIVSQNLVRLQKQLPKISTSTQAEIEKDYRPSAIPVWTFENSITVASTDLIAKGHRDLRENGLTPFSPWTAQLVGQNVVCITPTYLEARDQSTGKLEWARPLPQYGARILDQLQDADNPLRSWNISRAVLFRIFGESLYSSFSHDGKFIYLVEETETGSQFQRTPQQEQAAANKIVCLKAESGELVWENASIKESVAYLCSPPQIWNNELLLLAEFRNTPQIQLIILDRETGKLTRELPLAEVARPIEADSFEKRDGRRQKLACPIQIAGTKAFCPTGAGLLACVDLFDWTVDWVYRYPRHDVMSAGTGLGEPRVGLTGYQWWSGWQEIQSVVFDDYLVFASPESHLLTLLDRRSGQVLWTTSREDGLYIARADRDDGILIIGSNYARSYSVENGKQLWETRLNFPVGRGVVTGDSYLLPESEYGWSSLSLKSGELTQSPLNLSSELTSYHLPDVTTPRNFISLDQQLYELSFRGISRSQTIKDASESATSFSPKQKFLHRIENEIPVQGDEFLVIDAHEERLEYPLRYLFNQQLLKQITAGTLQSSEVFHQFPIDQNFIVNLFCHRLQTALSAKNFDLVQDLLREELSASLMSRSHTSRRLITRLDRWLLAMLKQARSAYTTEERAELDRSIDAVLQARMLDHPTEKLFFAELFRESPWSFLTTKKEVDVELATLVKNQLVQIQKLSRESLYLSEDGKEKNEWSQQKPEVSATSRLSANVFFQSVPIKNIDGTQHTDMNLEIEFPGHRRIRFSGEHWQRPWPAYLPRSERSLRLELELVRAWAVGKLMIIQVGSEVYGFSPLTAEGHRGAKLLWPPRGDSIDTLGDRSNQMLSFQTKVVPEQIGFPEVPVRRMNEFGHFATAVGPVRAGYFCIQQKGMLVAYETSSGKELWRRYDLPQQAECFGDEDYVVVISENANRLQIISTIDGSATDQHTNLITGKSIIAASGVHCLLKSGDAIEGAETLVKDQPTENLTLEWVNLVSGETIWKKNWISPAIPFEIDGRWIGVCLVEGQFDIIDLESGELVTSHQVQLPDEISKIACHAGDQNLLLLVSGKISDEKLLNATQQNGGYRRVLVDGPIFGLSRTDAAIQWTSRLDNVVFPLDQPVDLPVFVTAGSRFPEEIMDDHTPGSRIQLFDRRTGELLYSTESLSPSARYSATGDQASGKVILTTRESIITVDYSVSEDE